MPRKQTHRTKATKQARYRDSQKRAGVPTGEVVAMSGLRCVIARMLLRGNQAAVWAISDYIERDLLSRHYARTLTADGIEKRFTAIVDDVEAHLAEYKERISSQRPVDTQLP